MAKRYAEADKTVCVSCGACVKVCPKTAICIQSGCYAVVDRERCVGCGMCQKTCPAVCITLKERGGDKHENEALV